MRLILVLLWVSSLWASRSREQVHLDHLLSIKEGGAGGSAEFHSFQDELSESYESEHFEFFYDFNGIHAINNGDIDNDGVPDYIELMEAAFEDSWTYYFETNSYPLPRWFGDKYPVFLRNLDDDYYGYMSQYGIEGDHPGTAQVETTSSRSFIVMRNGYDASFGGQEQAIQVTAAHEFFHSIQAAYSLDLDLWFLEGAATTMESRVFPTWSDNHQYLFAWFEYSDFSLDFPDSRVNQLVDRVYGSWVIFEFLETNFPGIIAEMTQDARSESDAFQLLEQSLADANLTVFEFYEGLIQSFFEKDYPGSNTGFQSPYIWEFIGGFELEGVLSESILAEVNWDSEEEGDGRWRGHSVDLFEILPQQRVEIKWDESLEFYANYLDRDLGEWQRIETDFLENNSETPQILALFNWEDNSVDGQYRLNISEIPEVTLSDQLVVDKMGNQLLFKLRESDDESSRLFSYQIINANGDPILTSGQLSSLTRVQLENGETKMVNLDDFAEGVYFIKIKDTSSGEEVSHQFLKL